jgi:hypothetical protein
VVWSNTIFMKLERVFIKLPEWWLDYILHKLIHTLYLIMIYFIIYVN